MSSSNISKFPLGFFEFDGGGFDRSRIWVVGRASWTLRRDGFGPTVIVYRNHLQERDYILGPFSPDITGDEIMLWIAQQTESHRPADWVRIGNKVMAFTADRGAA